MLKNEFFVKKIVEITKNYVIIMSLLIKFQNINFQKIHLRHNRKDRQTACLCMYFLPWWSTFEEFVLV